jgi:hypothetical protein
MSSLDIEYSVAMLKQQRMCTYFAHKACQSKYAERAVDAANIWCQWSVPPHMARSNLPITHLLECGSPKRWAISGSWKSFPRPPTPQKKESVWLRQIAVINGIIFFASTTVLHTTRRAQTASRYMLQRVSDDVSANPTSRPTLQPCKHHIARTYIQ